MAKLAIGAKVFIIHSGELGIILDFFSDDFVAVDIDGDYVKVHESELISAYEMGLQKEKTVQKETAKSKLISEPGIQLVFIPIKNLSKEIIRYDVFLNNNTEQHLLFLYTFSLLDTLQYKFRKELVSKFSFFLHEFKTDMLNDQPISNITFWIKTKQQNTEHEFSKELKLKAKQFFSKIQSNNFQEKQYLSFEIFSEIPEEKNHEEEFDWDAEEKYQRPSKGKIKHLPDQQKNILQQKAQMPDHIDLHIEKLIPSHHHLSNTEILQIQISQFKSFLEKAIRLQLDKIYIIHGVGKGVLRTEIEKCLKQYPEIVSSNNQFHPRFGFGATEIILQKSSL